MAKFNQEQEQEEEDYDHEEQEERSSRKRRRSRKSSDFMDDHVAEEEEEEEDEDFRDGSWKRRRSKRPTASMFLDIEAEVDDDEEDNEDQDDEGEDGFIVDDVADIPDEDDSRRIHRHQFLPREDEQVDVEELERTIQARFSRENHMECDEYDEEMTEVEKQALLPSVRDPKLWMVKCAIGHERDAAGRLMQKCIDKGPEIRIRSVIALDNLKNYIYIEADKESHVREACKGLRNIYLQKVMLVPIKEMTSVLSVESKVVDLARDTWVRIKIGIYKGDLAKVVDVDNVRLRVKVKLIPRIDLQTLANKLDRTEVQAPKKKAFVPPARFMNVDEARELNIPIQRKHDSMTGEYFENICGMFFKDGFLYKTLSLKSLSVHNIKPTFDELEKFRKPGENIGDGGDIASLSTLFANQKKGRFKKGDTVTVVQGELKNSKGQVEIIEEEIVHIKLETDDRTQTLAVKLKERELCKYFEPGNHVKVVSGTQEGATGTVVKVEQHVLIIVSDITTEHIRVFADDVVESSEVTNGVTGIGDYELYDLVLLDNMSFGVIISCLKSEAFQVLKGIPDRSEVDVVKLGEIKCKIDKKIIARDRFDNTISFKDIVRILEGPSKDKQGPVEHIHKGVVFIYDRHRLKHPGFICARAQSCYVVGGSRTNRNRNRFPRGPPNHRGGRGHDGLVGSTVKIRQGPYKGYCGCVVEIKGQQVRVALESRVVTVDRNFIADNVAVSTPYRDTSRYGLGSETPMPPSRTPPHPYMTPMRDSGATPVHDGMRTPMRDRAWNPYAPMSPARDNWEEGNPANWGTSPHYQPRAPSPRTYEVSTPGSGSANTPCSANASSPYLPSTPGGQPMTPDTGCDTEGPRFMTDILVDVRRPGAKSIVGVIREVLPDGACRVDLGSSGNGETITALPNEMGVVVPKKWDKIKIIGGALRGATGKLYSIDGTDCLVKVDETLAVKILDLVNLAKLAQS